MVREVRQPSLAASPSRRQSPPPLPHLARLLPLASSSSSSRLPLPASRLPQRSRTVLVETRKGDNLSASTASSTSTTGRSGAIPRAPTIATARRGSRASTSSTTAAKVATRQSQQLAAPAPQPPPTITDTASTPRPAHQPHKRFAALAAIPSPDLRRRGSIIASTSSQRGDTTPNIDNGGGRRPRAAALRTTAGSTPTLMRTDETMIWNVQPPDMPSSSLFGADTDEDDEDDLPGPSTRRRGRGVPGAGRLMTPVESQEVQTTRPVNPAKRSRGSLPNVPSTASKARLPTPEPSQILRAESPPPTLRSRAPVRPRDSLSPPRTAKQRPRDVVAEYDEPLHDADDTPNPRRKKAARLSDTPTSAARPPSPSPPSSRKRTSPPSTTVSKRSDGHTPAPRPRQRAPPATAPVKSASHRAETPRTQPSSLTSPPKSCKVETARFRRSLTPVARKALKGVVVGYKDRPVQAEPGEDPLLLLPEFVRRQRRRTVNPISSSSLPSTIKRKKRAKITQTEPRPKRTLFTSTPRMEDGDLAEYGNVYGELDPGAGSDSDDGGAANDTFVDVMARRGETRRIPSALGSMPPITADTILEEDEAAGSSPFIQPSTTLPAAPTPKRTSPLQGLARFVDRNGDAEEDQVVEREPAPAAARSPTPAAAEDDYFLYDMAPALSPPSSPFAGNGSLRGTVFSAAAPSIHGTPALEHPSRSPEVQRDASRTPQPEQMDEDKEEVDPADDKVIVADEDVDEEYAEVPRSPTPVRASLEPTYVSPQRSPTPVQDRHASVHNSPAFPSPTTALLATSQGHRTRSSILRESLELAQRSALTPVRNGSASASHSPVAPSPGSLSSSQRRRKPTGLFMESIEIPTSHASLVRYGRRLSDNGPASPFKHRGISPREEEEEDAVVPPISDHAAASDHEEIDEDHVDDHPPSSSTAPSVSQPSAAPITASFEDDDEHDWEDDAASIASEAPSVGQPETAPVAAEPVEDEDEVDWNDAASIASLPPSVGHPETAPFDAGVDNDSDVYWDDATSYSSLAPSVGQPSTAPLAVSSDVEEEGSVVAELEEEFDLPLHHDSEAEDEDEDEDPRDTTIRIATLPQDEEQELMEERTPSPAPVPVMAAAEELEDVNPEDDTVILADSPAIADAEDLEDVDAQDDTVIVDDTPAIDDAEELEDVSPNDNTMILDNTSFASDSPIASPRSPLLEGISAPSSPPLTPGYFMRLAQARQSASPAPMVATLAPSSPVVTPSSPVLAASSAALVLGPPVARALSPIPAQRSPTPAQRSPALAQRTATPAQRSPVADISSPSADVSPDTSLDVTADTVDVSVLDVSVDTVADVSALDMSADTVIADVSRDEAASPAPASSAPMATPLSDDAVDTSTDSAAPADTSKLDVSADTLPADLRTSAPVISSDSDHDIGAETEDEDSSRHSDIDASAYTVDVSTDSLAKDLSTLDVSTDAVSVHEEEDEEEPEPEAAAERVADVKSDLVDASSEAPVATTAKHSSPGPEETDDGPRDDSHWSPSPQPRFDLADIVQAALGAGMVIDDEELAAGFGGATTGLDFTTGPVPSSDVAGDEDNSNESREPSPTAEETIPLGHRRRMFAGSTPVRSRLSSSFSQASSSPARSVRSFHESLRLSLAAASSPARPVHASSAAAATSSDEAAPPAASSLPAARPPPSQVAPLETPWRSLLNAPDSSDEEEEDVPVPAGVVRPPTPPRPHRDVTPSLPTAVSPAGVEETAPAREQTPAADPTPAREHTPEAAPASPLPPAFSSCSPSSPTSAHSPRRTATLASPRMSMSMNVRLNSPASDPTSPSPAALPTPHRTPQVARHHRASAAAMTPVARPAVGSPVAATPGPAAHHHLLRDPESPFVVASKAAVSSPLAARKVAPVREVTPVHEATPAREATPREVTPVREATPPGQAAPQHDPTARKVAPRQDTPLRTVTSREATRVRSSAPPTPPQPPSPTRCPPLAPVDNDEDERVEVSAAVRGCAVTPLREVTPVREATPVESPARVEEPVEVTTEATPARGETPEREATPIREATPAREAAPAPTNTEPTRHMTPPAAALSLPAPNTASPRRSPRLSKTALPASPASPVLSVTSPRRSPRLSKTPSVPVRASTPLREVTPAASSISPSAAVLASPVASLAPAVPAFYRGSRSPTPSPLGEASPLSVLPTPSRPVSLMASPIRPLPVPSPQKLTVFPLHTNTTFNNVAVADRLASAAAGAAPSPAKTRRSMALNIPIVVSVSNEDDQLGDETIDGDSSLWDISASDMTFDADEPGPHHFAEHDVVGDVHWDATRIEAGMWSRSVTPAVERSTPSLQTDEDSVEPEPEEVERTVRRTAAVLQALQSVTTTLAAELSSDHHDGEASMSDDDEQDEQHDRADDEQDEARGEDAGRPSDAESENGDDEQQQSEGKRKAESYDEEEEDDEEEEEGEEGDDDVVEEYDVPLNDNKIVLRIVPRGIVKVEPGEEHAEEAEEEEAPPVASLSTASVAAHRTSPAAPVQACRAASPSRRVFPLPPPPRPSAHTSTTTARPTPPPPAQTTSVQPSVFRYAQAAGTDGVNNLERVLSRRRERSKSRDRQQPTAGSSRRRPVVSPQRSLHEELAAATDNSFGPDDSINSDDSFRSVVEVSSMDPRAAARAAAILKMHHAYIETGVLPDGTPAPIGRTTSTTSRPSSRRGSVSQFSTPGRGDRSRFFDTEESARTLTKEELLYEAELEIANATTRYERSVSRLPHDESPPHVPGAWATGSSTAKRKRGAEQQPLDSGVDAGDTSLENEEAAPVAERPWTVSNWRHLEKVYRAEQQKFNAARAVVPLPTWSPWPLSRPAVPSEWDNNRVIDAFVAKEGIKESGMVGEWTRDVLNMRVEALSRRVARVQAKSRVNELATGEPATKRPRGAMAEVEPPSTMKRMMNWVFGTGAKPPTALRQSTRASAAAEARRRRRHNRSPTPAVFTAAADSAVTSGAADTTAGFLQRVDETFDIGDVTMAATPLRPVSMPAVLERRREMAPPMREREREAALVAIPRRPSAYPRPASTEYRYAQAEPPSLYAPLYPSLPERSAAIAPIVSGTPRPRVRVRSGPNGELVDVPTPVPPRRSGEGRGVRDIVRSLEDSGKLELSFESARRARERGQVGELRRVRSLVEQVEEGSFSL